MKQIYNFEANNPPVLNESMLRAELERRQLRRQTTLTAIAGILTQLVVLIVAFLLIEHSLLLAVVCISYVIFSTTGGTIVAIFMHSSAGKRALHQA